MKLNDVTIDQYQYDAHGNMLCMPHLPEMKYDYLDQLNEVALDLAGNKAFYNYDYTGTRSRKTIVKSNITEETIYLGDYEIFRKFVSGTLNTMIETNHISEGKQKICTVDKTNNSLLTSRFLITNHLGSSTLELDENGAIISYEEYHPFGTTSYRAGRNAAETSLKRYKYVMKELDNETGLYYYGMRYYAPWLARFVSLDPLQVKYPIYTPYQYAGNQPITFIDLDGAEPAYSETSLNYLQGLANTKNRERYNSRHSEERQQYLKETDAYQGAIEGGKFKQELESSRPPSKTIQDIADLIIGNSPLKNIEPIEINIGEELINYIKRLPENPAGYTRGNTIRDYYTEGAMYANTGSGCYVVTIARINKFYGDNFGFEPFDIQFNNKGIIHTEDYDISNSSKFHKDLIGYGPGAVLISKGLGEKVTQSEIMSGKLEKGAIIQGFRADSTRTMETLLNNEHLFGHSLIFDEYKFDENGNPKGFYYYDYEINTNGDRRYEDFYQNWSTLFGTNLKNIAN